MLTAELVLARTRKGELFLRELDDAGRERALHIATELLEAARSSVGEPRETLDAALDAVDVEPRDVKLRAGLAKLLEDRCELTAPSTLEPELVRRTTFALASAARERSTRLEPFSREAVMSAAALELGTTTESLEEALFADLRGAQRLVSVGDEDGSALLARYSAAQAQAVLLRAVRVTVDVFAARPEDLRAFFRKLKFLRLLFTIEPRDDGFRVTIDGPFSLFESVTKYGLSFALLLPALELCERWSLVADVRWGKARLPHTFKLEGGGSGGGDAPALSDEVAELAERIERLESGWRARPAARTLSLPGVGLVVPDLVLERGRSKAKAKDVVYVEVLGYWSRDAVWRRVELVEAGLAEPTVFAVSARLRVSEAALGDTNPSALYVYKGVMSARAVLDRAEAVASRARLR